MPNNRCFWTVVLEKTLESSWDYKKIKLVNPKGNQSWIFTGRIDVEVETPILWSPVEKSWLTGKDHEAGKNWGQEEKRMREDEMVGWYHRLNGHEFEQAPGDSEGQGSLVCCTVHGVAKSLTGLSDWTELISMQRNLHACFNSKTSPLGHLFPKLLDFTKLLSLYYCYTSKACNKRWNIQTKMYFLYAQWINLKHLKCGNKLFNKCRYNYIIYSYIYIAI